MTREGVDHLDLPCGLRPAPSAISPDDAIALGVSRIAGDTREQNLQLVAVKDRLRQSRNAKIGTCFLVLGFALQIVAAWPG